MLVMQPIMCLAVPIYIGTGANYVSAVAIYGGAVATYIAIKANYLGTLEIYCVLQPIICLL